MFLTDAVLKYEPNYSQTKMRPISIIGHRHSFSRTKEWPCATNIVKVIINNYDLATSILYYFKLLNHNSSNLRTAAQMQGMSLLWRLKCMKRSILLCKKVLQLLLHFIGCRNECADICLTYTSLCQSQDMHYLLNFLFKITWITEFYNCSP